MVDPYLSVTVLHYPMKVMYYANGGSSYLERQADMACDVISLDWAVDMVSRT